MHQTKIKTKSNQPTQLRLVLISQICVFFWLINWAQQKRGQIKGSWADAKHFSNICRVRFVSPSLYLCSFCFVFIFCWCDALLSVKIIRMALNESPLRFGFKAFFKSKLHTNQVEFLSFVSLLNVWTEFFSRICYHRKYKCGKVNRTEQNKNM